jgi:hypothetical protein
MCQSDQGNWIVELFIVPGLIGILYRQIAQKGKVYFLNVFCPKALN